MGTPHGVSCKALRYPNSKYGAAGLLREVARRKKNVVKEKRNKMKSREGDHNSVLLRKCGHLTPELGLSRMWGGVR